MEREERIAYLKEKARQLRINLLTMIYTAQSGHPGGSLSAADYTACLYFDELNVDPENPKMENRDRVVLSKGHCCPVIYTSLIMRGFMPWETLYRLRKFESPLQGHPDMKNCPGLEFSTGSLGQGLSGAVGMAYGYKYDNNPGRVYAIIGDGENEEGQIWEAALSAAKYKLDNLVCIVDNNGLQNDGFTKDQLPNIEPLGPKWELFGWEVIEIDGHDVAQIIDAFAKARTIKGKPVCIIAKTVKGKGVSFMENECIWHGKVINDEQYKQAIEELGGVAQ